MDMQIPIGGNSVSTTGIFALYNKYIVLWRSSSKLQKTISLSMAEVEYYAASEIAIEIVICCTIWASRRTMILWSMKTTQHASNGKPYPWRTLAKHINILRFRSVTCVLSEYRQVISWLTYSRALPPQHFERCVEGLMCGPDLKGP